MAEFAHYFSGRNSKTRYHFPSFADVKNVFRSLKQSLKFFFAERHYFMVNFHSVSINACYDATA